MAIYPPTPVFSETDKKLIILMTKLLTEKLEKDAPSSNLPVGIVALTDQEADELLERLEALINSREFTESCYFVEGLTLPGSIDEPRLREIYLSARKRRGRKRALASIHWSEFQVRLGIIKNATRGTHARQMDLEYFQKMERRLLAATGIHPQVAELIMRFINAQAKETETVRSGRRSLQHGSIRPIVADPIYRWRESRLQSRDLRVPAASIAAAITIVADISVLFTTRDWSVTGTLSTMAGALAAMVADG